MGRRVVGGLPPTFLLSRITTSGCLVVATVRTDGLAARPRARRLVGELGRLPSVRRLDLDPFDAAEVAEYLALAGPRRSRRRPPARSPTRCSAAPAATPTSWRRSRPTWRAPAASATGVPPALADLLARPAGRLPDPVRTVVRCAAITSQPVSDRLLRRVAGPRRRQRWTRRCASPWRRGCWCRTAPATRSRTTCCAPPCTTTCCPASAPGCTRPAPPRWRAAGTAGPRPRPRSRTTSPRPGTRRGAGVVGPGRRGGDAGPWPRRRRSTTWNGRSRRGRASTRRLAPACRRGGSRCGRPAPPASPASRPGPIEWARRAVRALRRRGRRRRGCAGARRAGPPARRGRRRRPRRSGPRRRPCASPRRAGVDAGLSRRSPRWCSPGRCSRPVAPTRRGRRPSARSSRPGRRGEPGLEVEALTTLALPRRDRRRPRGRRRPARHRPAPGPGRGRAGRGAARALLAGVAALLQRGRQRRRCRCCGRRWPGWPRAACGGASRASSCRLLHAVALYVSGDLDGSLRRPRRRRAGRPTSPPPGWPP